MWTKFAFWIISASPRPYTRKRLEGMFSCKDKFCPFCNWRRARKLAIQSYELLEAIQKKKISDTFFNSYCKKIQD